MDKKFSTQIVSLGRSPNRHIAKLETRKSKTEGLVISEFPPTPILSLEDNPLSMDGLTEPPDLIRSKKKAQSIHEVAIKSQLSMSNSKAAAEETSDEKLSVGNSPPKSNEKSITPERLDGLWKLSQDEGEEEDEEAVDLPPGGWFLFDGSNEEDEENDKAASIKTPPRSTPKKGDLGITPDRTHSSISTPQKPFNRSITSGSTLQTEDGLVIPFESIHIADGGCGEIERLVTNSANGIQKTGLVAKKFKDKLDPELKQDLLINLNK